MSDQLQHIYESISLLLPETIILVSLIISLLLGLFRNTNRYHLLKSLAFISFGIAIFTIVSQLPTAPRMVFGGMMRVDEFSSFFKILFLTGGVLGVWMYGDETNKSTSEYLLLLNAIVLGSCFLASSMNFIMVLLSLELISLSSYLLAGFGFDKKSAEGSLKYFLFGSVATACMIYGLSIIYGLAGTLDFSSEYFVNNLIASSSPLLLIGGLLALAGLLFKITAAPFHLWAPDVYEAAPTSVVAFISVVPKLAGIAMITRFTLAINLFGQSGYNWQMILAFIAMISILIGNLSALAQKNAKRMLAYSSVAQAGFLLVGIVTFSLEGVQFMFFYAAIFLVMNFLVFHALHQLERSFGQLPMPSFGGLGMSAIIPSLSILIGLIALTGLPPTAGFTAKLLIFGSLWGSYQQNGEWYLLSLFIVGLLNTVISLFFYLKIPYYLFMKDKNGIVSEIKTDLPGNLLSLILVIVLFYLFISPGGLMGWINKITFVL
jgi:NADH-quinone oxidoreductase subunit N